MSISKDIFDQDSRYTHYNMSTREQTTGHTVLLMIEYMGLEWVGYWQRLHKSSDLIRRSLACWSKTIERDPASLGNRVKWQQPVWTSVKGHKSTDFYLFSCFCYRINTRLFGKRGPEFILEVNSSEINKHCINQAVCDQGWMFSCKSFQILSYFF